MTRRRWALIVTALGAATGVYLINASWLAPAPHGRPLIFAHRGVHQTAQREKPARDTCADAQIEPPRHALIENSLPSMAAAFAAGADVVEIDVVATADGKVVIFHDRMLDCKTDGRGPVGARQLGELKTLDIGHGYTADDGLSFPLRGTGIGRMPALEEVLAAFPRGRFVVHVQGRNASDADALVAAFARASVKLDGRFQIYGNRAPIERLRTLARGSWRWDKHQAKSCVLRYVAFGWTGIVTDACRATVVPVPLNYRWLAWGWPNRFLARMHAAGSLPMLLGEVHGLNGTPGIDRIDELRHIPPDYDGGIWTDAVEVIGPALRERRQ